MLRRRRISTQLRSSLFRGRNFPCTDGFKLAGKSGGGDHHVRRMLPFLLLGPLTGPLTAGLIFTAREGRFGMAAVYLVGVVEVVFGLPTLLLREVHFISTHLR
jgi:hypothetical protein